MAVNPLTPIWALLRLQRQAMANAFREHAQKNGLPVSILISTLWYGVWLSLAAVCAITPHYIGVEDIEKALPGILLFVMGYWQLSPIITLSLGVSIDMRKLAYYPVKTPQLFIVECLLRVWTGIEIIVVLCGLFLGLITAGTAQPAALAVGLVLFLAFNIFLSAGIRNLIERIFRKKILREMVLVLLVTATVVPQMLVFSQEARAMVGNALSDPMNVPWWASPGNLAASLSTGQAAPADFFVLIAMVVGSAVFGYVMFATTSHLAVVESTADQGPAPARRGIVDKLFAPLTTLVTRLVPDPIGTLAEKEIKYLWRSPRFRTPFFMGFTFAVIAWAPIMYQAREPWGEWMRMSAPALISMYTFLLLGPVLFLNRFGFDRAASRFYFWMPIEMSQLLMSKNIATVFFCYCELLLVTLVCAVVGMEVTLQMFVEAFLTTGISLLWLLSVGNQMSVHHPSASNPNRVSHGAGSNGMSGVVRFFAFPLALAPVFSAFVWRFMGGGDMGFVGILGAAAGTGIIVYYLSFLRATKFGYENRETIVSTLSAGQGPLAAD